MKNSIWYLAITLFLFLPAINADTIFFDNSDDAFIMGNFNDGVSGGSGGGSGGRLDDESIGGRGQNKEETDEKIIPHISKFIRTNPLIFILYLVVIFTLIFLVFEVIANIFKLGTVHFASSNITPQSYRG